MSERSAFKLPGTPRDITCDTWRLEEGDRGLLRDLLHASGIDLSIGPIDVAIGGAHPIALGHAVLESMTEQDRQLYEHERLVIGE